MISILFLLLILVPFIGAAFTSKAKNDRNYAIQNVYNVSIWVLLTNIGLILYTFSLFDLEKKGIQIIEKYAWLNVPSIEILLGADTFSLLLLLSINLSFLIAIMCLNRQTENSRILLTSQLIFLGFLNGYILAADIISFYIFFAAVSIPLIVLISSYGNLYRKNILIHFSLYNLLGMIFLLISVMMIYNYKKMNIPLNTAGNLNITGNMEYIVWLSLFIAFVSRMPIWPFHYWIASVNATLRNPLVFLSGNLIPIVGLYGFMRFWPNTVPQTIAVYAPIFEVICIITMLLIAVVNLSHKELRYKLFAYITVYDLLYLIGVFLPTGGLKMNIGYALFSYMIIITILALLMSHIEREKKKMELYSISGILCYMPRMSICLSLFVLAAIGLPITPLFLNNFIIISKIFNYSLILGILAVLSLSLIGISLLEELYKMKDKSCVVNIKGTDLSKTDFAICLGCLVILFFSFIKPWWFVL